MKQTAVALQNRSAEIRAEEEATYRRLHGKRLPDVELLRSRGFVVTRMKGGLYRVDNRQMTADELAAKAAAERSKGGAVIQPGVRKVMTTASGLRVGQSVPINDDKAKRSASGATPLSAVKEKLAGAALQAKQRAEQASTDLGPEPRLEWVPKGEISIDRRYQREMGKENWAHANRIMREWSWLHYQPIVIASVAHDNGTGGGYVVVDGQHRLEAAKKHPLIDRLPAYIVSADLAQQARAFVVLNARRIGVTRLQRFWASYAADDPVARRIHRICADAGVAITRSGGVLPPKTTFATFTLEKLLPLGGGAITTALKVLAETHGDARDAFKSPLIFALVQVAAGRTFSRRRLVEVLKAVDLDQFMGRAKSWRGQNGGTLEKAAERELRLLYDGRAAA